VRPAAEKCFRRGIPCCPVAPCVPEISTRFLDAPAKSTGLPREALAMAYANTDGGGTHFSADGGWKGETRGESSRGSSLRRGQAFIPSARGPPDPNSTRRLQRWVNGHGGRSGLFGHDQLGRQDDRRDPQVSHTGQRESEAPRLTRACWLMQWARESAPCGKQRWAAQE
jgi:hypothetical protein